MFAHLLLDASIPTVLNSETVDKALFVMQENYLHALPVINEEGEYAGIINEEELLDVFDGQKPLSEFISDTVAVRIDEHFFNILKNKELLKKSIAPVVEQNNQYAGVISDRSIIQFLAHDRSIEELGGIIVLEIKSINYSLAEMARIVESNNANIIHSYISSSTNSENILITLKINKTDLKEIVLTFERFNYHIVAVYHTSEYEEGFKERYDSLMVYLNV